VRCTCPVHQLFMVNGNQRIVKPTRYINFTVGLQIDLLLLVISLFYFELKHGTIGNRSDDGWQATKVNRLQFLRRRRPISSKASVKYNNNLFQTIIIIMDYSRMFVIVIALMMIITCVTDDVAAASRRRKSK